LCKHCNCLLWVLFKEGLTEEAKQKREAALVLVLSVLTEVVPVTAGRRMDQMVGRG